MSTSFQCPHCSRNFSTRNAYSQHVNRCINTVYLSTEESSEDISDIVSSVNEMSLDDEDFKENSQVFYQYESDQDYAGDISFGEISHSSNIPEEYENFDEILPASLQSNKESVSHSSNILEEYENFDEILPASLQSNEEPEVENIKEFPNEAYVNLMALVIENNLNNKAGNAIIKFFNKHSDLSQFQDYFIHYRPIKNCIKNLLSNPDILKNLMFRYENSKIEDEKSYGEQNSRNWWKQTERSISNHANILSIILYSDATTTDTLGKSSLHPIYVSLGNIPTWRRNKEDAKQLLGYLPILSAKNEKEKKFSEFKELARETFHNSIKFLLDPLFQGDEVILRNHVNMKEYFDSNTSNLAGLEQVNNYFWNIPNLNIYAATVPDRMHHLDLVNERIADIPRHSQLKVFKKGIQLFQLTASEYKDIMKIIVFVVDDLQIENLSEVYVKWNEMYLLSRLEKFKESDLENFQKAINDWGDLFIKLFQKISNSHLKFPKLHSWIYHIVDTIREYGAINGYTTETYESLHKTYVKIPYHLSNKKEVEKQIMENIRRRAIVSRNRVGKTKTPMAFVYTAKLFDFDLSESIIEQNKKDLNLDKKMIKGFEKFIDYLKVYFNILNIISAEDCQIKIYSSVTLKNGAILRTKNDFYHRPWFSNIAVDINKKELSEYLSNKGICYTQK
ncbi:hypothetical protein Glove_9g344 [Diversispora epigaea]|uniref:C2H2-type domain-containing protein n=1 Tax=Diversispora epigaea TaxID=1348612 RepID=A0A397JXA0_9GLOM|nr:hypothetical protein Glove_9g344 [Diversispora epigaea]